MKKILIAAVLAISLFAPRPARAQFGIPTIVYDPMNYANDLLRYAVMGATYLLAQEMATHLHNMPLRYLLTSAPWIFASATDIYGNTTPWVGGANTGVGVPAGYAIANAPLQVYNHAFIGGMPLEVQRDLLSRYATVELRDGAAQTALETIGNIRANSTASSSVLRNIQADSFSDLTSLNSQVDVLNKVNATGVLGFQTQQDTNKLLISILEQQTIAAKSIRDAQAESINLDVYRQINGPILDQQLTSGMQAALASYTIP